MSHSIELRPIGFCARWGTSAAAVSLIVGSQYLDGIAAVYAAYPIAKDVMTAVNVVLWLVGIAGTIIGLFAFLRWNHSRLLKSQQIEYLALAAWTAPPALFFCGSMFLYAEVNSHSPVASDQFAQMIMFGGIFVLIAVASIYGFCHGYRSIAPQEQWVITLKQ